MTLSGIITPAALNAEFDAGRSVSEAGIAYTGRGRSFPAKWLGVTSTTEMRDRAMYFKVADTYEVTALRLWLNGAAAATVNTTIHLDAVLQDGTDANTDTDMLGDRDDLTLSVETTDAARVTAELDVAAGRRCFLRPGVLYRLRCTTDSTTAIERAMAAVVLRAVRRRR